jgi:DnaK suppressor protein
VLRLQVTEEIRSTLTERLAALRDARERIEKDAYCICQDCSDPIPDERLELVPEAAFCVTCQAKRDRRRRRRCTYTLSLATVGGMSCN